MTESTDLLSTREAARILGVTSRTVQRFADTGTLVPEKRIDGLRGALVFDRSDVTDLAERRERAA